jgi:hypothetical protein
MKIEIIKSDIVYSDDRYDKDIDFVYLVWRETVGVINKRKFRYHQLMQNEILFNAFKKKHPEFFV